MTSWPPLPLAPSAIWFGLSWAFQGKCHQEHQWYSVCWVNVQVSLLFTVICASFLLFLLSWVRKWDNWLFKNRQKHSWRGLNRNKCHLCQVEKKRHSEVRFVWPGSRTSRIAVMATDKNHWSRDGVGWIRYREEEKRQVVLDFWSMIWSGSDLSSWNKQDGGFSVSETGCAKVLIWIATLKRR